MEPFPGGLIEGSLEMPSQEQDPGHPQYLVRTAEFLGTEATFISMNCKEVRGEWEGGTKRSE